MPMAGLQEGIHAMSGSASEGGGPPAIDARVTAALTELGFSQYEARTYAGLIGREPMTGYAIAKDTLVPQPKVYETLGRLVERGAVMQVSGSPAKFVAIPPDRVLGQLEKTFRQRLATVELEVSRMRREGPQMQELRLMREARSWITVVSVAKGLIGDAAERLYVSGHGSYLDALAEEIQAADRRGVRIDILCFGEPTFSLGNGVVIRHSSTDGVVYRHHQARHLAVTSDNAAALWALAPEGDKWEAIWADNDPLLTALVKGFVRHDIFAQRMFRDFSAEMVGRYGQGLEGLFDRHLSDVEEGRFPAAGEQAAVPRRADRRPA
jgi:HTH-type transcriptional regulator, sugar sensing transcriptional regulator